jgi:hypothetical protein
MMMLDFIMDGTAGAIGEIMSGAVWVPADLISQRLMIQGASQQSQLYSGMIGSLWCRVYCVLLISNVFLRLVSK